MIVAHVSGYLYLLGWLENEVVNLGREVSTLSVEVESNGEKIEALRDYTNCGFERLEDIILDEGR